MSRATLPRIHPDGGWYCEHGTGKGTPCGDRAAWVLESCASNPGHRPGALVCNLHVCDPRLASVKVKWIALPPPLPARESSGTVFRDDGEGWRNE